MAIILFAPASSAAQRFGGGLAIDAASVEVRLSDSCAGEVVAPEAGLEHPVHTIPIGDPVQSVCGMASLVIAVRSSLMVVEMVVQSSAKW